MPKLSALVFFFVLVALPPLAVAAEEIVNVGPDGIAIDGFDTVAYFVEGRPVKGDPKFSVTYKGHQWIFANAANREAFAADPDRFAPQYNGFCAVAVSEGSAAEVDFINGWTIQGDRLYLNWTASVKEIFLRERDERIRSGKRLWPEVHSDMKHGLRQIARHKDFPERGIVHPQMLPEN